MKKTWSVTYSPLNSVRKRYTQFLKFTSKGPLIFYEVGGAGGIWGGHRKKKTALKGGHLKKIRERGGHVKYYLYWRGGRGKKFSYWGGHTTF